MRRFFTLLQDFQGYCAACLGWVCKIPHGFRVSIVLLTAAAIVLGLMASGPSFFLLEEPLSLTTFADRNANTIAFDGASDDFGTKMRVTLVNPDAAVLEKAEKLKSLIAAQAAAEESGEGETQEFLPADQVALIQELSGMPVECLDGSFKADVEIMPPAVKLLIKTEGALSGEFERRIENPTPEELATADKLKEAGERFAKDFIAELKYLLPEDARERDFKFDQITFLQVKDEQPAVRLTVMLQPLEQESLEFLELTFEEQNTVHESAWLQYQRLDDVRCGTVVERQLQKLNDTNRKRAEEEIRREKESLSQEAEAEIKLTRQNNRGRIDPDLVEAIRKNWAEKATKKLPEPILRDALKQSEIEGWYDAAFKEAKFNADNLRYAPRLLAVIHDNNLLDSLGQFTREQSVEMFSGAWFGTLFTTPSGIVLLLLVLGVLLSLAAGVLRLFTGETLPPIIYQAMYWPALAAGIAFALYWCSLIYLAFDLPDQIMTLMPQKEVFSSEMRNDIWFDYLWCWLPVAFFSIFCWFPMLLVSCRHFFGFPQVQGRFDEIAGNLLCRGSNSNMYKTTYGVLFSYFFCMMVLPLLSFSCYEEDEYGIPAGDGGAPQSQPVQVKKIKKKQPKKRYLLNPNSAFIFDIPDMPDAELSEDLDEATAQTYTATGGPGGFGAKGGKGGRPGWPNGMEGAKLRFIRLEYKGGDWDQDMGKGADYNMLLFFKRPEIGFQIADETEHIKIEELEKRFRNKKKKPPFVYITGRGGISITNQEVKQLRDYLLRDGGMLFADNGGGHFDSSFRSMIKRVLPNHQLVDIANDDVIYQHPYIFPNGAPQLWHHSGTRALGIKNNGSWIVFYHQGDINDAWKTGASGASAQTQEMALRLGANVIAYAFQKYLAHVYGSEME